jgi:hypothetical protein
MSEKYTLNKEDFKKVLNNAVVFLAPLLLIYLGSVISNIGDGFALTDFIPDNIVIGAMVLYLLNAMTDVLKKYSQGK